MSRGCRNEVYYSITEQGQDKKERVEGDVEKRKAVNITPACRDIYQLTERVRTAFKSDNNLESGLDHGDDYLRGFGSTVQAIFPICGLPECGMLVIAVAIVAATSADLEKPNNKLGIQGAGGGKNSRC